MRSSLLLALPVATAILQPAAAQQQTSTTTAFDAWVMGCNSTTQKDNKVQKACEIRSTIVIKDEKTNQQGIAAVVAIGRASTEKPEMQFIAQLPLNAILNVPVKISGKDGKSIVDLAFFACNQQVCNARATLTDAQIAGLKKVGDNFYVNYRNQMGQDLKIEGSTKGFAQALDALVREK